MRALFSGDPSLYFGAIAALSDGVIPDGADRDSGRFFALKIRFGKRECYERA